MTGVYEIVIGEDGKVETTLVERVDDDGMIKSRRLSREDIEKLWKALEQHMG